MATSDPIATATAPVVEQVERNILDPSTWTQDCAASHFGLWLIDPAWMRAAVEAVKEGTFTPYVKAAVVGEPDDPRPKPYRVVSGIAVLPVVGPIMKARSKYGGTSSVDFRVALRKAQHDESVDSILLQIDSPGGAVAGTFEAAKDVARANESKPVYAHIEDLGCSGAYLLASQTRRITADDTSFVGSIGVVTSLVDESAAMAKAGIKVITVSTGGMKGAGRDGKVTDEMVAETQEQIDAIGEHFVSAVASGRGMTPAKVRGLADGRVHIARQAKELGLIDEVASLDAVVESILQNASSGAGMQIESTPEPFAAEVAAPVINSNPITNSPEVSPIGAPSSALPQETSLMANDSTQTPPAITPAAVNNGTPQGSTIEQETKVLNVAAIAGYRAEGKREGIDEGKQKERDRMQAIINVCPGNAQLAIESFLAGQDPATVKIAYEAVTKVQRDAAQREHELRALQEREIARLHALMSAGGHPGVALGVAMGDEEAPKMDPKAQADWEWENRPAVRKTAKSKENYILARAAELDGTHRTFTRETVDA